MDKNRMKRKARESTKRCSKEVKRRELIQSEVDLLEESKYKLIKEVDDLERVTWIEEKRIETISLRQKYRINSGENDTRD